MPIYCLKAACPDHAGIVSKVTGSLAGMGCNLLDLSQHTVLERSLFLLRAVAEAPKDLSPEKFLAAFQGLAETLAMRWELHDTARRPKVAVLASQTAHCLYELLLKHADGHLPCEFTCVISNHPDLENVARHFDLPFHHVPCEKGQQEAHEARVQELLENSGTEFVVLARYMRVLTPVFVKRWQDHLLNIHHGFLPAFQGSKPYAQAWEKGVKIIGATAHFATAELDSGPIVAQDVIHVSDRCSAAELSDLGKDVERQVLARALKTVLEHRVFVDQGRTFILD
jgi:formyltetrahydrofolate deformylase